MEEREAVCEVKQETVAGPFCLHRGLRGIVRGLGIGAMATWGRRTAVLGSEAQPWQWVRTDLHPRQAGKAQGAGAGCPLAESQELSF